jgi:hypothetical protein
MGHGRSARRRAFSQICGGVLAFGMIPAAATPTAHIVSGEGKTMQTATKRTLIAAAALTAAALFGSLPFHGSAQAQGVRTVHRDVALVDTASDIIGSETSLDNLLYGDATGGAATLYTDAVTAFGATDADALLGTTTEFGASGIFDGAYDTAGSGVALDTWAAEDELNQLLGIPAGTSEAGILADIGKDPIVLPAGDALPTAGAAGFDTDLMNLASADFTAATSEFTTYLDGLPTALGDLSGGDFLTTLLGDLTGGLDLGSLGGLGTDLTTLLDGLAGLL